MAKKSYPRQLRAPLTVGTVIRAIFAEQLYRAFTIIRNEPYHHE